MTVSEAMVIPEEVLQATLSGMSQLALEEFLPHAAAQMLEAAALFEARHTVLKYTQSCLRQFRRSPSA